jgi:hypothetical protein
VHAGHETLTLAHPSLPWLILLARCECLKRHGVGEVGEDFSSIALPRLPAPPSIRITLPDPRDPESQIIDIHHAVADASLSLNLTMEAPPGTQRSSQRRQPVGDFVQPTNPSNPSMNTMAASGTAPRSSSGSARSHSSRNISVSSPRSTDYAL